MIDNPRFATSDGQIYPGDETIFWYGTIKNVDMSALPGTGLLEYEVEYSAVPEQATVTTNKVEYTIYSLNPQLYWDWIYLPRSVSP